MKYSAPSTSGTEWFPFSTVSAPLTRSESPPKRSIRAIFVPFHLLVPFSTAFTVPLSLHQPKNGPLWRLRRRVPARTDVPSLPWWPPLHSPSPPNVNAIPPSPLFVGCTEFGKTWCPQPRVFPPLIHTSIFRVEWIGETSLDESRVGRGMSRKGRNHCQTNILILYGRGRNKIYYNMSQKIWL
jgi:hypothetical protein